MADENRHKDKTGGRPAERAPSSTSPRPPKRGLREFARDQLRRSPTRQERGG